MMSAPVDASKYGTCLWTAGGDMICSKSMGHDGPSQTRRYAASVGSARAGSAWSAGSTGSGRSASVASGDDGSAGEGSQAMSAGGKSAKQNRSRTSASVEKFKHAEDAEMSAAASAGPSSTMRGSVVESFVGSEGKGKLTFASIEDGERSYKRAFGSTSSTRD